MAKHYSVYETKTDKPVIIYGTSDECAKAMGITRASFYKKLNRQRLGEKVGKCEIFEDEDDLE